MCRSQFCRCNCAPLIGPDLNPVSHCGGARGEEGGGGHDTAAACLRAALSRFDADAVRCALVVTRDTSETLSSEGSLSLNSQIN